MKRKRLLLTVGQKQQLCKYKAAHPTATTTDIAMHFGALWSLPISSSTMGDILRSSEKWLTATDTDLQYLHYVERKNDEKNEQLKATVSAKQNRIITANEARAAVIMIISYIEAHPPVVESYITVLHQILSHIENKSGQIINVGGSETDGSPEHVSVLAPDENVDEVIPDNQYLMFIDGQLVEYLPNNEIGVSNLMAGSNSDLSRQGNHDVIDDKSLTNVLLNEEIVSTDATQNITSDATPQTFVLQQAFVNQQIDTFPSSLGDSSNTQLESDNEEIRHFTDQGGSHLKVIVTTSQQYADNVVENITDHSMRRKVDMFVNQEEHITSKNEKKTTCELQHESMKMKTRRNHGKAIHVLLTQQCSKCNRRFETLEERVEHENKHLDPSKKAHQCDTCGKTFRGVYPLNIHERVHTGEKPLRCVECGKCFASPSALRMHCRLHTGKKNFVCTICGKRFVQSGGLKTHMLKHTGDKPFLCEVCNKHFGQLSALHVHKAIHTGIKLWTCATCGKSFGTKGSWVRHCNAHKPNSEKTITKRPESKEFHCKQCTKSYYYSCDLRTHVRVAHIGDRPYFCQVCDKRFGQSATLRQHGKVHTKLKPFSCDICGKAFNQMANCRKHRLVHTGERPYVCEICGKVFNQTSNLNSHILNHHTTNKTISQFNCLVCERTFKQKGNMERHMKIHTRA